MPQQCSYCDQHQTRNIRMLVKTRGSADQGCASGQGCVGDIGVACPGGMGLSPPEHNVLQLFLHSGQGTESIV